MRTGYVLSFPTFHPTHLSICLPPTMGTDRKFPAFIHNGTVYLGQNISYQSGEKPPIQEPGADANYMTFLRLFPHV